MSEHASTLKHRRDAARRRVRRQRASIYEWSEGIHEVEATRVAHASLALDPPRHYADVHIPQTRQDLHDHHEFIQTEWLDRLQSLQRERGIWGSSVSDDQWALDFTEGKLSRFRDCNRSADTNRLQATTVCGRRCRPKLRKSPDKRRRLCRLPKSDVLEAWVLLVTIRSPRQRILVRFSRRGVALNAADLFWLLQSMWNSLLRQSRVPSPRKKSPFGPKAPTEVKRFRLKWPACFAY